MGSLPPYPSCDYACFVRDFSSAVADVVGGGFHLVGVVLGGLVLWVGFILARWILNGCSFHNRRGGGRRF